MRSVARHHDEEPPPEPREDPRARAAELDAAYEAVLSRLEMEARDGDLIFEVISLARQFADHTSALEKLLAAQYGVERAFAAGVALGESRTAARQRTPGPRHASGRGWLNVVKVLAPAAGLGLAARVWSAHRVVTASLAASAATAVTVAGMQARTLPDYAAVPRPPAWHATAVPLAPASPGAYVTATRPKPATVRVRPLVTAEPPAPVPSPSASVSTVPSEPPSPPPAVLQVSTPEVDLGALTTGQVTLTATGGTVAWHAVSPAADLTLSSYQGTAGPGEPGYITITVNPASAATSATITIWPGDRQILVTWTGSVVPQVPDSPAPDPSAS